MEIFYLRREGEERGPLEAADLREAGVRPTDLVRVGETGRFRPLSELIAGSAEARAYLEEGVEPDEPAPAEWQTRRLSEFSWVGLLLAADALWIGLAAVRHDSLASWANGALLVGTMGITVTGLLARRPWAWPLAALLASAMATWMLAPLIAAGGTGFAVWLVVNVLAALFIVVRRPRGPALDWPPAMRRLLILYSKDPGGEVRAWPRRAAGAGPVAAVVGAVLFYVVILGGIYFYHRFRFPTLDIPISLVPRGGDLWARAAVVAVYLTMVVLAVVLVRAGGRTASALGMVLRQGMTKTIWTGARIFLALFLVLLGSRWAMRSVEAIEARIEGVSVTDGGEPTTRTGEVREAVRGVVDRAPRRSGLSLWVLLIALLVGPICEEIFFWGLIFGAMRRKWPFWAAATASALVFASAHWLGAGWGGATYVLLFEIAAGGMAAAYAYELTGSLLAPITLHILWNGAQTVSGMAPLG